MRDSKGQFVRGHVFNLGRKVSKEIREKISIAQKGRHYSSKTEFKKGHKNFNTNESIEKISQSLKGKQPKNSTNWKRENHPKWKGGITPKNKLIRESVAYKLWRKSVFDRDNYTCVWCRARSGNGKSVILNADHIKRFSDYPELRFALDNGRTLCKPCHLTTYGRPKKC